MEQRSEPSPIASQSAMSPSGVGNGFLSPPTLGLVACGGVGAFLFTATYLIEGVTRPDYDAWQQPISSLSLGPGGWVQQVNFVVFGILLLLSSAGWYRFLAPGKGAIWFPLFQGISGLALIVIGFFPLDPLPGYPPGVVLTAPTLHGTIHTTCAYVIIISFAFGCIAFALRFAREPRWRLWAAYSVLTSVFILVFWEAFVQDATAPTAGFIERLSAGSHALWLCLLTATLLFHTRQKARI